MSVPILDAASVVLLRDGPGGLEVLMGRRNSKTRFSAGAWVFPGGAVDTADREASSFCASVDVRGLEQRFGDVDAKRFYIAAARELYEEAGVWLFDHQWPADPQASRSQLHNAKIRLSQLLQGRSAQCALDQMYYFDFWTTPPLQPRRYRTRFFTALMPPEQEASADGVELLEVRWVQPQSMLDRYHARQASLIFPTIKQLEKLAAFENAQQAWAVLRQIDTVAEIRTRHRIVDGKSLEILMPGEPGYDDLPAW